MRRWFILFNLCVIMASATAQTPASTPKEQWGITFSSLGDNTVYQDQDIVGAASHDGDFFWSLGLNYIHPINHWLDAEFGIEYTQHHLVTHPNLGPDMDNSPRNSSLSIISIPANLRMTFLKYFYVNGGIFLAMDTGLDSPIEQQTGLGAMCGFGVKYDFKSGLTISVNPYTKAYALVDFSMDSPERILENGLRLSINYPLH